MANIACALPKSRQKEVEYQFNYQSHRTSSEFCSHFEYVLFFLIEMLRSKEFASYVTFLRLFFTDFL